MATAFRQQAAGETMVDAVRRLAVEWDGAGGGGLPEAYPAAPLAQLHDAGALAAFATLGGPTEVDALRTVLRLVGGADLSLGRVFEGHVNAAQLVHAYGDAAQRASLADDLAHGRVLGVWNTEPPPGLSLGADGVLAGAKCFATGAGFIDRALVTARLADGGKQLVLVDLRGQAARADNARWQVRGMKGTMSGTLDFTSLRVSAHERIGTTGDYEREPRFSAGAWRFAAVQLGAVEALLRHWRDHLRATPKADDPIQRLRFGRAAAATRSAGLWVARASRRAEAGDADAVPLVLMTRGLVEEAGLAVMEGAARAVGTASFFTGNRIDRITRDLGLYLRQPVPDQARDRAAAAWLEADRWGEDDWW